MQVLMDFYDSLQFIRDVVLSSNHNQVLRKIEWNALHVQVFCEIEWIWMSEWFKYNVPSLMTAMKRIMAATASRIATRKNKFSTTNIRISLDFRLLSAFLWKIAKICWNQIWWEWLRLFRKLLICEWNASSVCVLSVKKSANSPRWFNYAISGWKFVRLSTVWEWDLNIFSLMTVTAHKTIAKWFLSSFHHRHEYI